MDGLETYGRSEQTQNLFGDIVNDAETSSLRAPSQLVASNSVSNMTPLSKECMEGAAGTLSDSDKSRSHKRKISEDLSSSIVRGNIGVVSDPRAASWSYYNSHDMLVSYGESKYGTIVVVDFYIILYLIDFLGAI